MFPFKAHISRRAKVWEPTGGRFSGCLFTVDASYRQCLSSACNDVHTPSSLPVLSHVPWQISVVYMSSWSNCIAPSPGLPACHSARTFHRNKPTNINSRPCFVNSLLHGAWPFSPSDEYIHDICQHFTNEQQPCTCSIARASHICVKPVGYIMKTV